METEDSLASAAVSGGPSQNKRCYDPSDTSPSWSPRPWPPAATAAATARARPSPAPAQRARARLPPPPPRPRAASRRRRRRHRQATARRFPCQAARLDRGAVAWCAWRWCSTPTETRSTMWSPGRKDPTVEKVSSPSFAAAIPRRSRRRSSPSPRRSSSITARGPRASPGRRRASSRSASPPSARRRGGGSSGSASSGSIRRGARAPRARRSFAWSSRRTLRSTSPSRRVTETATAMTI